MNKLLFIQLSSIPNQQAVTIKEAENCKEQTDFKSEEIDLKSGETNLINEETNEEETSKPKIEEKERNVVVEPDVEENEMQPISAHPVYAKYFKMVHFGVPKPAVKIKMQQDGIDSSILE